MTNLIDSKNDTVVIVGASHAAADAIAALRRFGWIGRIVLIGDEDSLPYQRPPLSKGYFSGAVSAEKLLIRPDSFYTKNAVELTLGHRVTSIERDTKHVILDDDTKIKYSHLILATGTRARPLPVPGATHSRINYLRTANDVDRIISLATPDSKLLIIGAGYIGLEVAASASKQGVNVTVVEAMDRVLARVTSPLISDFYQKTHTDKGVKISLNTLVTEFTNDNGQLFALTDTGDKISFDSAIIGIGVIPNTELAQDAGLNCNNGIEVDQHTQTDDPFIHAIGDCSNHPNFIYDQRIRLESVPNAMEQAKVAASVICGERIIYDSLPWFWSDQYDIKLQTAGLFNDYDEVVVRGDIEKNKFAAFYLRDKKLIAVDAINSPAEFMVSKKLIIQKACPDQSQLIDPEIPIKSLLAAS